MGNKVKSKPELKVRDWLKNEYVLLGVGVLVVFIILARYIPENYSLKVWGDDFGYWQSAAYLTGKDWSSVASTNSYYGFGYGILLAPIMLLFGQDSVLMLQVALLMEAVMLSSCVVAAYKCIGFFNDQVKGITQVIMAIVPMLYPYNVLYVNITMAEVLLVTLIWWYTFFALKFIKEKKIGFAIVIIVFSVYMYAVHQRTIAVMLVSMMLVAWVYREKLTNPKFWIIVATLIGGIIIVLIFKNIYVGAMYHQTDTVQFEANNLAGQGSKIVNILTSMDGFTKFFMSLVGKFFYIIVGTFFFIFFGILKSIQVFWESIKERKVSDRTLGILVICLNFLAAYLISAIYMSGDYSFRTDVLIYGRYTEHSVGPLIIIGMLYLYEYSNAKAVLASIAITTLSTFYTVRNIGYRASHSNLWANCSAIRDLFEGNRYLSNEGFYVALFRGIVFLFLLFLAVRLKKYFKDWGVNFALFCISVMWVSIGYTVRNEYVIPWADELYKKQEEILSYVDTDEFGIYNSYIGGFFQFLRVDAKVANYDDLEEILNLPESTYIITYAEAEDISLIRDQQEIVFENEMYVLWKSVVE